MKRTDIRIPCELVNLIVIQLVKELIALRSLNFDYQSSCGLIGYDTVCSCSFTNLIRFYPEDGGNIFLRNVSTHLNYALSLPRIPQHEFSQL
jgi:hypothetical protein